jgi:hypothetical protein
VDEAQWTLDELAQRARRALAAEGVRAPNGRVRELGDDGRAIRWYSTKGLVDRPAIGPGHSARYGRRHLLQLVAVKRLQSRGKTLAEIQQELAGATDAVLGRIAEIAELGDLENFGGTEPARSDVAAATPPARRFWAASAESSTPAAGTVTASAAAAAAVATAATVGYLITLTGFGPDAVTLTLPAPPDADDLASIRAAAAPLLDLLADRGLTTPHRDHDQGD